MKKLLYAALTEEIKLIVLEKTDSENQQISSIITIFCQCRRFTIPMRRESTVYL